jgi:hypothetical protein
MQKDLHDYLGELPKIEEALKLSKMQGKGQ